MAHESCFSNYVSLVGISAFFFFFLTHYVTLGVTNLYFYLSGSIKWAHCRAEDNDYIINDFFCITRSDT